MNELDDLLAEFESNAGKMPQVNPPEAAAVLETKTAPEVAGAPEPAEPEEAPPAPTEKPAEVVAAEAAKPKRGGRKPAAAAAPSAPAQPPAGWDNVPPSSPAAVAAALAPSTLADLILAVSRLAQAMAFPRVADEDGLDIAHLQPRVHLLSLCDVDVVILLPVNDQQRRLRLLDVRHRRTLPEFVVVIPRHPVELGVDQILVERGRIEADQIRDAGDRHGVMVGIR